MIDLDSTASEPLDLAAIEARDAAAIARMRPHGPSNTEWNAEPGTFEAYRERSWFDAEHDRRALLAEVNRLRTALATAAEREQRVRAVVAAVVDAVDEYADEAHWQSPIDSYRFKDRLYDITHHAALDGHTGGEAQ